MVDAGVRNACTAGGGGWMHIVALLGGLICCLGVILDAFQTIILPRRPTGRFRITKLFYLATWGPWVWVAERISNRRVREQVYSIFGPISLLLLLVLWAGLLICGFGFCFFALGSPFHDMLATKPGLLVRLRTDLYVSGTTLFTLGLGDVTPLTSEARGLVALESGVGLAFVALVIGYVPVLYGAFSRREVTVAMLDGRAGSPPTAGELLRRHGFDGGQDALIKLLEEWERWSAELLESHISYPILCYYRSQHDNQSWLSALVAVLDACALLITTVESPSSRQAQLTFAMARHAVVDLCHVFQREAVEKRWAGMEESGRMDEEKFDTLCDVLGEVRIRLCGDPDSTRRLRAIRKLYEPQALALSDYLKLSLPAWVAEPRKADQWKTVETLRTQAESAVGVDNHLSDRATSSSHLHDDDRGH